MTLPRKTVKPAHPGGDIPDPDHGNMALPQAGAEVVWNAYWIGRLASGDVLLVESQPDPAPAPSAPEAPASGSPEAPAS